MTARAELTAPVEVRPILGLRTPYERAAEVERLCGYSPDQRGWWEQDCRIEDAKRLRKRLAERHVPYRLSSLDVAIYAREQNERIDRVCKWAVKRMKRADDQGGII